MFLLQSTWMDLDLIAAAALDDRLEPDSRFGASLWLYFRLWPLLLELLPVHLPEQWTCSNKSIHLSELLSRLSSGAQVNEVVTMEIRAVSRFFSNSKASCAASPFWIFGMTVLELSQAFCTGLGGPFVQVDGPRFVAGALRWGWAAWICSQGEFARSCWIDMMWRISLYHSTETYIMLWLYHSICTAHTILVHSTLCFDSRLHAEIWVSALPNPQDPKSRLVLQQDWAWIGETQHEDTILFFWARHTTEIEPRRHPGLEFNKYRGALLKMTLEGAEEAKRNGSEGFQGNPRAVGVSSALFSCSPVQGAISQTWVWD